MSLLTDTRELLDSFKNEDIKILHLIDRIGYDTVINEINDLDLINEIKRKLPLNLESLIEEDNIEIVCHLAHLENPFIKEHTYIEYFQKSIAVDLPMATISNIIRKDIINGEQEVVEGFFKNPFTGMLVEIKASDLGNYARINRVADRNSAEVINSVNIDINERMLPFNKDKKNDFNLEFIINHELAHITGVQLLNPDKNFVKNIPIVRESHSDVVSLLKIIKDHDLDKDDSLSLIDDLIIGRSNIRMLEIDSLISEHHIDEHFTQPTLFLLKDFLKEDFNYIKDMKIEDITKFSIILAEEAAKEQHLINISKQERVIPEDKNELLSDFTRLKKMTDNNILTKIVLKAEEVSGSSSVEQLISNKLSNCPNSRLSYELMLLCAMSKKDLLKIGFPDSKSIISNLKSAFEKYKKESEETRLNLSEFFDYKEVKEKTKSLTVKMF